LAELAARGAIVEGEQFFTAGEEGWVGWAASAMLAPARWGWGLLSGSDSTPVEPANRATEFVAVSVAKEVADLLLRKAQAEAAPGVDAVLSRKAVERMLVAAIQDVAANPRLEVGEEMAARAWRAVVHVLVQSKRAEVIQLPDGSAAVKFASGKRVEGVSDRDHNVASVAVTLERLVERRDALDTEVESLRYHVVPHCAVLNVIFFTSIVSFVTNCWAVNQVPKRVRGLFFR
jgi:hypothetical protein